jgi:hypothetical protein
MPSTGYNSFAVLILHIHLTYKFSKSLAMLKYDLIQNYHLEMRKFNGDAFQSLALKKVVVTVVTLRLHSCWRC